MRRRSGDLSHGLKGREAGAGAPACYHIATTVRLVAGGVSWCQPDHPKQPLAWAYVELPGETLSSGIAFLNRVPQVRILPGALDIVSCLG